MSSKDQGAAIDLEAMTVPEIDELTKSLAKARTAAGHRDRASAREEIEAILRKYKLKIPEVFARNPLKKSKTTIAAKYQDPDNSANKWSGRGMSPKWFKDAIEIRKIKREKMLIKR